MFNNEKEQSFKDNKNLYNIIYIIIISSWVFLAGIVCYTIIIEYGINKTAGLTGIHWNIAAALFIITLAFSFFLQTILIEIENKNELRNKINHALNQEHVNYVKKKRKRVTNFSNTFNQSDPFDNTNRILDNEKRMNDIISYFAEDNNQFLYQLYRQIQNLLNKSKEKQQITSINNGEDLFIQEFHLYDEETLSNAERSLSDFHIPDNILTYFINLKIKRDGLALKSYILPLSFFLFTFFAGFLIISPLINSILISKPNTESIPLFSLFSNPQIKTNLTDGKNGIPLLVIQWGFLGGFVYTSISLLNRFLRKDLPPRVYYNASFRLLLSGAASVIVFLLYKTFGYSNEDSNLQITSFVLLLCFSIGITPIQFLIRSSDVVLSKFIKFWRHKDTSGKRSLTNIEGIDSITAERLSEEGLDYIQQLALCDPIDISFKTKYPICIVKDWKDQAILYLLTADIIVTTKDNMKNQKKQYLYYLLNETYGIKRFSQFYSLVNNYFKKMVYEQEEIGGIIDEKNLKDFFKGLGFTDTDEVKFKYIIESIMKTGYSISELYYKYEKKQFIQ